MITSDPIETAQAAGLRYVSDTMPGIRRRRAGKGFSYRTAVEQMGLRPEELRVLAWLQQLLPTSTGGRQ